jgi:hypothetical protein
VPYLAYQSLRVRQTVLVAEGACRGYRDTEQSNEAPTVRSILMQPQPHEKLAERDTAASR